MKIILSIGVALVGIGVFEYILATSGGKGFLNLARVLIPIGVFMTTLGILG